MLTVRAAATSTVLQVVPVAVYHSVGMLSVIVIAGVDAVVGVVGLVVAPVVDGGGTSLRTGMRLWLVGFCACAAMAPAHISTAAVGRSLLGIGHLVAAVARVRHCGGPSLTRRNRRAHEMNWRRFSPLV